MSELRYVTKCTGVYWTETKEEAEVTIGLKVIFRGLNYLKEKVESQIRERSGRTLR